MLAHAKNYAKKHVEKLKQFRGETAESKHNPVIFESHHSNKVTQNIAKDLDQHLSDFKASGALDGLPPHKRAAAINQKIAEWHSNNKEQEKERAAEAARQLNEIHEKASTARQSELLQQRMHLLSGGASSYGGADDIDELPEDLDYSAEDEEAL
jgi:ABC-type Zn uptake system ZnuABC Zn-binding protein ZnuA